MRFGTVGDGAARRPVRARGRRQRGAALVEFALVLPVLVCLLLGTITGGMALFEKITITDAVREGSRFAATLDGGVSNESAWRDGVRARILSLATGDLQAADICVELVVSTGTNVECGVADPPNSVGDHVVKVSARGFATLEALFFTTNMTLTSRTAALYERSDA